MKEDTASGFRNQNKEAVDMDREMKIIFQLDNNKNKNHKFNNAGNTLNLNQKQNNIESNLILIQFNHYFESRLKILIVCRSKQEYE